MKKGKKAAIIIIAVIAAAAIVVGGLVLGGVIPVGNKRTASAQEIAVDDTAMTAYKTIPQVYKITLKSLYGMSVDDVAKFYENNCEGLERLRPDSLNKEPQRHCDSHLQREERSERNGQHLGLLAHQRGQLCDHRSRRNRDIHIQCPRQGLQQPRRCQIGSQEAQPEHRVAENKSAANQSFVKFDMANADKFAIDIKF